MLSASWKPIAAEGLIRLGPADDGGYVVSRQSVAAAKVLVSMGLNDDWRFEEAFRKVAGARVICFDHTVDRQFWALHFLKQAVRLRVRRSFHYFAYRNFFQGGAEHRKVKIGYDRPGETSIDSIMAELGEAVVFLKVDIEGSEYRILDAITRHAARLTGIVLEFHDIDLNRSRIDTFLAALPQFRIISLNPNNYGGTDADGDPIVIEMSLVREDMVDAIAGAPPRVDAPVANDPRRAPIALQFTD